MSHYSSKSSSKRYIKRRRGGEETGAKDECSRGPVALEREKGNYNIFNWREYILYNTHCSNLQLINYIANNYKNKQKINIEQHVVCVERKNFGANERKNK